MASLIKVDKNGTKYYEGYMKCDRCDGVGIYYIGVCNGHLVPSYVDAGVCFKCNGSGKVLGKWKEYTPEHEAKLAAQRRKRAEKLDAEIAEKIAQENKRREEEEAKRRKEEEEEAQRVKEEKAKSQYYGNVGDKVDTKAVYKFSAWYECKSFSGYGMERHYIHNFKVGDNTLVWKTTRGLGLEKETVVTLKGTIKEHTEYNDEKQTILTRCKVIQ